MTDETTDNRDRPDAGGIETSNNRYKKDDGSLRWELIEGVLRDLCSGYLRTLEGVGDQSKAGANDAEGEDDVLADRLLKTISEMHRIALYHWRDPKDEIVHRLSNLAPVASKLSDRYAMEDRTYQMNWHDNVTVICEAIAERNRELSS